MKKFIAENAEEARSQIATSMPCAKEPEKMFQWLEHARVADDTGVTEMLRNPFLHAYKDDPRFIVFAQKIGVMPKAASQP